MCLSEDQQIAMVPLRKEGKIKVHSVPAVDEYYFEVLEESCNTQDTAN